MRIIIQKILSAILFIKLRSFLSHSRILRLLIVFASLSIFNHSIFSQHIEVSTGYGYYESLTASVKLVNQYGSKFGLSGGYDNNIIFSGESKTLMFDYQRPIFRQYFSGIDYRNSLDFNKHKHGPDSRYFLDFKFLYWNLVDDYYYWHSVSFVPSIGRNFQLSYHWSISVDAGLMLNFVLKRGRLNYLNAGWPYKVMPNFRVLVNYILW